MNEDLKTDVLVVGAGPTGLMAANQLARFGVDFMIVDKKEGPTKESRAIMVTARSLEIYQQMGLHEQVLRDGKKITAFKVYSGGKAKASIRVGEIGKGLSQFSYVLAFEQSKNEHLLTDALTQRGTTVHWKTSFVQLAVHPDLLMVEIDMDGTRKKIETKYLIACDGANSAIRQQLQFRFDGGTYAQKFFVADTRLDWNLHYDQIIISPGDENFCGFLPLYGDDGYRVLGTLPKKYRDREQVTFEDIEQVIKKTIAVPVRFKSVNWFSIYKLHHRCVDHFREGRVFLAGDSAHIHSPAGGQGMNTGLQDAYNLCWKLALVLNGQAKPSLLDTYNEERLPFAEWLLQFTDRGFNLVTNENPIIRILRKYVGLNLMGLLVANRWFRPMAFKIVSQLWYSYKGMSLTHASTKQSLSFRAGDRVPYIASDNIHLSLRGAAFHILHFGEPLRNERRDQIMRSFPFKVSIVEVSISAAWQHHGVTRELFILVRPDNYIALISDVMDKVVSDAYLNRHFKSR